MGSTPGTTPSDRAHSLALRRVISSSSTRFHARTNRNTLDCQRSGSEVRSCVKVEVAVPGSYGFCGRKATLNRRSSSVLLYVHKDSTDYLGRGAQDVHLDFHTAPDLCVSSVLLYVRRDSTVRTIRDIRRPPRLSHSS